MRPDHHHLSDSFKTSKTSNLCKISNFFLNSSTLQDLDCLCDQIFNTSFVGEKFGKHALLCILNTSSTERPISPANPVQSLWSAQGLSIKLQTPKYFRTPTLFSELQIVGNVECKPFGMASWIKEINTLLKNRKKLQLTKGRQCQLS